MAWIAEFPDLDEARDQARKAMHVPIGLASPLWLAFGAATTAGVAWWWMTRWTRALNVEAMAGAAKLQVEAVEAFIEQESEAATRAVEVVEAAVTVLETTVAAQPDSQAALEAAATLVAEAEHTAEAVADDLTTLAGIGPKLALALAEHGVTTFAQLAAWTAEDAARFDAELSLKGRVARDAWVAQAKRLAQ
jgi:predicted flap endonuclease-1-like 5' DNA nuclease